MFFSTLPDNSILLNFLLIQNVRASWAIASGEGCGKPERKKKKPANLFLALVFSLKHLRELRGLQAQTSPCLEKCNEMRKNKYDLLVSQDDFCH